MKKELNKILLRSKAQNKLNADFLKKSKKTPKRQLDQLFHDEHYEVFEKIDCLDCANCCKTTSPIFRKMDIKKMSSFMKMKEANFINEYLRMDEDEDYVLKSSPCPFLMEDNKCFAYEYRPAACREYPHTDRKNMYQILTLTKNNTLICPAAAKIVENIRVKKQFIS